MLLVFLFYLLIAVLLNIIAEEVINDAMTMQNVFVDGGEGAKEYLVRFLFFLTYRLKIIQSVTIINTINYILVDF